MEDEWEEEEQLVVVELSGMINSDFLTKCKGKLKVVGIDTEQPMMQVGTYVFAGEYEDVLGTCVIFEEGHGCDADSQSSPKLKYKCHTVKKLMMQRTFLTEKKEGESSSEGIELLQLHDGDFPYRNSMICNFIQDSSAIAASSNISDRGVPVMTSHSPRSESEAEASDSEQVEHSQDATEMDCDPGTSVCQEAEDNLDKSDRKFIVVGFSLKFVQGPTEVLRFEP
ncbi:hypothetical protein AAFF_G00171700 [Aldrovandia affinis]|uniref:General transcription factor 3C polypeptide 6 n=1 Tax=Aldrovandia affinis TaxID=143900 RepID=A0AAD7WWT5_9TELE|nr:hypothetical protein AAFF_G00171700 [Aldrovandia affinis]